MSTAELLDGAARALEAAGVPTPMHDAKLLLAHAFGVELRDVDTALLLGRDLSAGKAEWSPSGGRCSSGRDRAGCVEAAQREHDDNTADEKAREQFFLDMVDRRAAREPLQYIVGHAPFRYFDLLVGPGVFIPRSETETVVQVALDWLTEQRIPAPRLVDLCAGSGAIGLALVSEVPDAEVWAVEQSNEALVWTRRNRDAVLGVPASSQTLVSSPVKPGTAAAGSAQRDRDASRYHLLQGDATAAETLCEMDGTIDAVVTNPPYVPASQVPEQPEVRDHDPAMALYGGSDDGLRIPELIIARAAKLLRPGGLLVMEHDISQGKALVQAAQSQGFDRAATGNDLTGRPRYLYAFNS